MFVAASPHRAAQSWGQTPGQNEGQTPGQNEGQTPGQNEGQSQGQTRGHNRGLHRRTPAPATRRTAVRLGLLCIASLLIASCGGIANLSPTAPSRLTASSVDPDSLAVASPPVPSPVPAPVHTVETITGVVGSVNSGAVLCSNQYPCAVYDFTLPQAGAIDVTLTWDGAPRALIVQLYWAGEGLAHEDVAPRNGPARIAFRRPLMESGNYRLRLVSLEPEHFIPFSLTVDY